MKTQFSIGDEIKWRGLTGKVTAVDLVKDLIYCSFTIQATPRAYWLDAEDLTPVDIQPKECLYKTARATISCAHFKAGEFVQVRFSHFGDNGLAWYEINHSQNGPLPCTVCYHSKQLAEFCL